MDHHLNETGLDLSQTSDGSSLAYAAAANTNSEAMLPARPVTARKPAVDGKKHFACAFVHGPGAGCVMNTDSLTEMRVALVLLARPDVVNLENQVLFNWQAKDGSQKRLFFDFRATMADGSRIAIMVKYDKKLADDDFRDLIGCFAEQVTQDFADRVTIMTEKRLAELEDSLLVGLEVDETPREEQMPPATDGLSLEFPTPHSQATQPAAEAAAPVDAAPAQTSEAPDDRFYGPAADDAAETWSFGDK
ncbi:hypothetical protein D6850_16360 [Roseovarius spongiae]|uniref:Uncharacterized protein n=1 Tax=Roseovarius spongiae TaxID=2320272 RepID=A0A3A8B7U3_9RHOB|nr:hypothetical protein [Roseovarius spongiae]RKF13069.1 hypothetical protein D6850_16360 [Roseovarius spongiae]